MSGFSIALTVTALVISLAAALLTARIAVRVQALRDQFARFKRSDTESLQQQLSELHETVAQLANRVKMMKVRNAINHVGDKPSSDLPDPHRDPDGWRRAMNAKLSLAKLNGGS